MNQAPDADGIVRRVPLVIRFGSQLFPTLSLEMFRVYNFIESYELVTQLYGDVELVQAVRVGKGVGSFEIPTDGFGQVNVPYVAGSSLVLVGTSAPGLGDLRAMPLQQVYPGVEVHANMLNALLGSRTVLEVSFGSASTESVFAGFSGAGDVLFPYRPDWEAGALLFIIMVLGVAMAIIFPHLGAASMAATAITLSIASVWINFQLWANFKMDFALVLLLLLILLVTAVNMIYGFLSESQTRRTIKGMFDRYVPPAHIDSMLEDPDNCTFEGESKELTVLFSDIRSFTTISEALSATELKTLLNDFFTPITEIIFKHNGTVDKYVGDMVMVFWGRRWMIRSTERMPSLRALRCSRKWRSSNRNSPQGDTRKSMWVSVSIPVS